MTHCKRTIYFLVLISFLWWPTLVLFANKYGKWYIISLLHFCLCISESSTENLLCALNVPLLNGNLIHSGIYFVIEEDIYMYVCMHACLYIHIYIACMYIWWKCLRNKHLLEKHMFFYLNSILCYSVIYNIFCSINFVINKIPYPQNIYFLLNQWYDLK